MLLLLLIRCCVCPAMGSKFNRNKLFPEYGINFRYIGEIKNGLDRVLVVTSVPLPHFKDIHISPLKFHNCSMDMDLNSTISKEHQELANRGKANGAPRPRLICNTCARKRSTL